MICVRFYARLADQVRCTEADVAVEDAPLSVDELLQRLSGLYPEVNFGGVLVAVNGVGSRPERMVEPGSIVSLLPPIAGG